MFLPAGDKTDMRKIDPPEQIKHVHDFLVLHLCVAFHDHRKIHRIQYFGNDIHRGAEIAVAFGLEPFLQRDTAIKALIDEVRSRPRPSR